MRKRVIILCIFLVLLISIMPNIKLKSYEPNELVFTDNYKEEILTIKFDNLYYKDLEKIQNLNIREITPSPINGKTFTYIYKTTNNLKESLILEYSSFLENNNMEENAMNIKLKGFKIESIKVLDSINNLNNKLKNINYEVIR